MKSRQSFVLNDRTKLILPRCVKEKIHRGRNYKHLCYFHPNGVKLIWCEGKNTEKSEKVLLKKENKVRCAQCDRCRLMHQKQCFQAPQSRCMCAFVDNISAWLTCDVSAPSQIWNTSSMMEHSLPPGLTKQKEKN